MSKSFSIIKRFEHKTKIRCVCGNQLYTKNKLELMTLEIVKALVMHVGPDYYSNPNDLVDKAENIAIALYNRFEENNEDEYLT